MRVSETINQATTATCWQILVGRHYRSSVVLGQQGTGITESLGPYYLMQPFLSCHL